MKFFCFYPILMIGTFAATFILTKKIIPKFAMIAKQPIYGDGPSWHMKKSGTPTMGGIGFIVPSIAFTTLVSFLFLK